METHHKKPLDRQALIERNRALVGFALAPLLRRFPDLSEADRADVTAAGLRALVHAADTYEPGRGQFSTYAVMVIQFAGRKALAARGDWKARRAGVALTSLDAPITEADGASAQVDFVADPAAGEAFAQLLDTADESERAAQLWAWIQATVTPRQLRALRLYYGEGKTEGMTGEEAAVVLGKSRQCVNDRLQGGLTALRKASGTPDGRQMARQLFGTE